MNKASIYKFSLFSSIALILIGALFKIQHHPGAPDFLITGILLSLIYIVIALTDIYKDNKISLPGKAAWLICFILITWIAGLYYYFTKIKPDNS